MESSVLQSQTRPTVLMGTCGWSDESIMRCGRFYPASCKTSVDRLVHYSRRFPCVEVDTSTYAIPQPAVVQKWAEATPAGFKFHVKAFGAMCAQAVALNAYPKAVREMPCMAPVVARAAARVPLSALPAAAVDRVWSLFHEALDPLIAAKKLGVVVFQFQLSFTPGSDVNSSLRILEACRMRLRADVLMAVELRARAGLRTARESVCESC